MKPRYIDIPLHSDLRGNLSVVDSMSCLPFHLKRIFYICNIPINSERGGHAHYKCHQFICCLSGSVTIEGYSENKISEKYLLSDPNKGLYVPPLNWTSMKANTKDCIYLVAASDFYDEKDYITNFKMFIKICDAN